jgi:hypothetical protein
VTVAQQKTAAAWSYGRLVSFPVASFNPLPAIKPGGTFNEWLNYLVNFVSIRSRRSSREKLAIQHPLN